MHDLFTVGVPLIAILAGLFFNNGRLDKLDARTEDRFNKLEIHTEDRFNKLEARMEARFNQVDARFERLETRMDRMQADLSQFYTITGKHEVRLDTLEKRNNA